MFKVKPLWDLQLLEQRLAGIEKDLKTSPLYGQLKKLKAEIEDDQIRLKKSMAVREALAKQIKVLEIECAPVKEKMKEVTDKLYSGETSNLKELDGMNHSLEGFEAKLKECEDKILAIMEQKEALEKEMSRENVILADKKQHFRQLHTQYQNRNDQLKTEKTELELARTKLLENIDKEILKKYNEMKNRIPDPVAKSEKGICYGCHMGISFSALKSLKDMDTLVSCDNCGRLLWPV